MKISPLGAIMIWFAGFFMIGLGVFYGEFTADLAYEHHVVAQREKSLADFDKWQRDQIQKYQHEHPGSKPETKDYPDSL